MNALPDIAAWWIAGVIGLFVVVWALVQWARVKQLNRRLSETESRISALSDSISALCSGAVGVDQRVNRLERRGRDLVYRQETMESQQHADRPYAEAISLVHKGATVERLEEELGLSQSEAELVFMLHGDSEKTEI